MMPDCSAVRMTLYLPKLLHIKRAVELNDLIESTMYTDRGESKTVPKALDVEWDEAPWGDNYEGVKALEAWATKHDVPWRTLDFGHYTWTGTCSWWRPGMDEPRVIPIGVEGEEMLHLHTVHELLFDNPGASVIDLQNMFRAFVPLGVRFRAKIV